MHAKGYVLLSFVYLTYGLLTKHEVKMVRYWPSSFFAWTSTSSRPINTQTKKKQEQGQYSAILTKQAWSVKDLLYGIKHQNMMDFPCRTKPVS